VVRFAGSMLMTIDPVLDLERQVRENLKRESLDAVLDAVIDMVDDAVPYTSQFDVTYGITSTERVFGEQQGITLAELQKRERIDAFVRSKWQDWNDINRFEAITNDIADFMKTHSDEECTSSTQPSI